MMAMEKVQASSARQVHAALITVQVLFALWPVAGASLLRFMSPAALVGVRLALGAPILALAARAALGRLSLPSPAELLRLAGLAALGISLNQLLFVGGLARSGPVNASVAVLLIPPFTVGAALLLGRERPSARRLLGVGVALIGGAVLVGAERFDGSQARLLGNLMLVANTACYALYLVLARGAIARLGSLQTVAWVMVLGALEALPLTAADTLHIPWSTLPLSAWGSIAFVALGPTVLTYLLNAWALARADSSTVATYVYAQPPIAALAAFLLLDITPTVRALIASGIIALGVALANQRSQPAR
jgi:drug/metabolite transporter (DMT)-like permease